MNERITKELPSDMGTISAIKDIQGERSLTESEFFKIERIGDVIRLTATLEVHDDVEINATNRRIFRI